MLPSHLRKLPPIARPLPAEQISPTKPPPCTCFRSIRPNAPAPGKSARHTHIVSAALFYIPVAPAIPHKLRIVATSSAVLLLPPYKFPFFSRPSSFPRTPQNPRTDQIATTGGRPA